MKKNTNTPLLYGLLTLASLLVAMLGYAYTHKPFMPENILGLLTALWQFFVAILTVTFAGGIGEYFLKLEDRTPLVRIALDVALGFPVLSIATLIVGSLLSLELLPLGILLILTGILSRKSIATWLRLLTTINSGQMGKYTTAIALMTLFIFLMQFGISLAPSIRFDTLVYHFSLPKAFLQLGRILYLPNNMFWGMPQNTEMLYLLAMRFAGAESAALVSFLIGLIAVSGIAGYINERFGKIAAWTAVAAMLAGESLTITLSSGYVEWTVILFGWAALAALDGWFQSMNRKMLVLCGIYCGAAVGTKYTAGIILLGCLAVLAFLPSGKGWQKRLSGLLTVGGLAVLVSFPWWLKNYIGTGNPFYPFFFSAGAMNEIRLFHYQNVPTWGDWRSVILLPWQATIWGAESKEGFSASIGAVFVGLSPLAWLDWKSRSDEQKMTIKIAVIFLFVGFVIWAIGSRFSGLLIQARLYFGIFPAWALLAGAGMEAVWKLRAMNIRFGRVAGVLVLLMLGFNLFATWTDFIARKPLGYVLRQETQQRYLVRNMGPYANVMETINELPPSSQVLMLWEARGYYCRPKCDADEVIDRWYNDINTYQTSEAVLQTWKEKGYSHLLLFQAGADFIRDSDPRYTDDQWKKLDTILEELPSPNFIGNYALYSLNDQ